MKGESLEDVFPESKGLLISDTPVRKCLTVVPFLRRLIISFLLYLLPFFLPPSIGITPSLLNIVINSRHGFR